VGPGDDQAWVAPEAAVAEEPNRYELPGAGSEVRTAAPGVDTGVRLPVPLRPMTMGDLLDGGFSVLRAAPRLVLGLAAIFVVPVQLVVAYLNRNALADVEALMDQLASNAGATQSSVGSPVATYLGIIGTSVAQTLVGAVLAILVVAWYADEQPDGREVLRRLRPRVVALVVGWLFVHLLWLAGLFTLFLGSLVVMALFVVTAPAIAIEGIGPFKGMGRSSGLAGKRFGFALGFVILSGLVASLFGQILSVLPQLLGVLLGEDLGWIALGVGGIISQLLQTTVVGASTALFYLDLRMRREGLDVAWAAERVFPA
jgi:hypothetical protein